MKNIKVLTIEAYDLSQNNINDISNSTNCYCYSCFKKIKSNEIKHYDITGAICPVCGETALIPDIFPEKIDKKFLEIMNKLWM